MSDVARTETLRRKLRARLDRYDLHQLELADVAMVRIDQSTDRVRDGLNELKRTPESRFHFINPRTGTCLLCDRGGCLAAPQPETRST